MPTTHADEPVQLAAAALRDELRAVDWQGLAGITPEVVLGFPLQTELELPRISLELGDEDWQGMLGGYDKLTLTDGPTPEEVTVTYRTHRIEVPVQLDLWTANRTDRFKLLPHLVDVFGPEVRPDGTTKEAGLEVVLGDYYDALVVVRWGGGGQRDREGASDGISRYQADLTVEVGRFKQVVLPRATWTVEQDISTDTIEQ